MISLRVVVMTENKPYGLTIWNGSKRSSIASADPGGLPPNRSSIWTRLKNTIMSATALTKIVTARRGSCARCLA